MIFGARGRMKRLLPQSLALKNGAHINFRYLLPQDLGIVSQLHGRTVASLRTDQAGFLLPKDDSVLSTFLADPGQKIGPAFNGYTVGCFHEGRLCGKLTICTPRDLKSCLSLKIPGTYTPNEIAELAAICVLPEYRNQGVQRKLFKIGTEVSKSLGRTPMAEYHWRNSQSWHNGLAVGLALIDYELEQGEPILLGQALSRPVHVPEHHLVIVRGWENIRANLDRGCVAMKGKLLPGPNPGLELHMVPQQSLLALAR